VEFVPLLTSVSASQAGGSFDAGTPQSSCSLRVTAAGSPSFSVQLQGSADGSTWASVGSPLTTATSASLTPSPAARYFRAVLSGFGGPGAVTAALGLTPGSGFTGDLTLSQLDSRYAARIQALPLEPAGATAVTFPRLQAASASNTLVSGTLYVMQIALPEGLPISGITMVTNTTAKSGGSHGWYVLLDSGRAVRAVSADQTDAATTWGTASTPYPLAVGPYTTTYAGQFYLGFMCAASSMPKLTGATGPAAGIEAASPVMCGSSSTGLTTPPATGTVMGAITAVNSLFYAWTS
jgi:hypothetical protein